MKNILQKLILLLIIAFTCPYHASTQDSSSQDLIYEVNRVYPPLSMTKEALNEAHTIVDLSQYYKPSWVKEYVSVEISTIHDGQIKKAICKNDTLNQAQKVLMKLADVSTDISVIVKYIPENNLKHNEVKEVDFTFNLIPEREATYPGGHDQLLEYLKANAIDNIPDHSLEGYDLGVIQFTVDEAGQIIDGHIFQSTTDEAIDALLLKTICDMPDWEPAEYSNGLNVKQEFAFAVGNMENCMLTLINIHPNKFAMSDEAESQEK